MAVRYSYLAIDDDQKLIEDWFAALPDNIAVSDRPDRLLLYFRDLQVLDFEQKIVQESAPFIFIQKPRARRGTLWTDCEVYFPATPLGSRFPRLQKISKDFAKWLKQFEMVFSQKHPSESQWSYYLEAGIQNYDTQLFALPKAFQKLRDGQYFVHYRANEALLDTLAKTLRIRGYETTNTEQPSAQRPQP